MVKTKVFVGNLSFRTQEADLQREFEVAGKVASTNIISRGSRSLGYGFVEMESEEEAKKAVELLNKKQLDGREINVELAKPLTENVPREGAAAVPRPRRERPPRQPRPAGQEVNISNNVGNNAGSNVPQAGQAADGEGEGAAPRRRRRPNRNRGPRKNADGNPIAGGEVAPAAAAPAPAGGAPAAPRVRRERPPRAPRPEGAAPRIAAPNTLFVANLPFSVDDNGLSQIFAGLNLKSAHVVRKRNDRSKGFGFVEFHNPEDQKKALAAVDKKTVENRELIVKLARTEPLVAPGSPAVAEVKKEAAAPGSPKTA